LKIHLFSPSLKYISPLVISLFFFLFLPRQNKALPIIYLLVSAINVVNLKKLPLFSLFEIFKQLKI